MKKLLLLLLCICCVLSCTSCISLLKDFPVDINKLDGIIRSPSINTGRESIASDYKDFGYAEKSYSSFTPDTQFVAGTLTAGEQQDTSDLKAWREYFESSDKDWRKAVEARGLNGENVIAVHVLNDDGFLYNVKVKLLTLDDAVVYEARTDMTGTAILYCSEKDYSEKMKISFNDKKILMNVDIKAKTEYSAKLDFDSYEEPCKLDLMFMIDTTGSMGDELRYIQEELVDVVERVGEDKTISIRVSVNFYRDEGDEYIVKYYDFRDDVYEMAELIKTEKAAGGGDFPEAVHKALENVVDHRWRDDAIKLCFLVLDAPPHSESEVQGVNASLIQSIMNSSQKGIRLIPVVASGINKETEYLFRTFAVLTNGTYIFLTDDSGYGNSHLQPDVVQVSVEPLNECLIRVISRYCEKPEYIPEPDNRPIEAR